jgi:uncharacterized protein YjiS (DUF1127 family)
MDTPTCPSALTAPTDTLARLAHAWVAFAHAAKLRWNALDARMAAHKRAARDHCDLAEMSDRELKDIGIDRASISAVASRDWTRDSSPY